MFLLLLDNLIRRFILSPLVLATWASSSTTYSTAITTKPIHFNVLLLALERSVDGVKSALHLRETLQLLRDQEEEEDEEGGGNDLEEEASMNTDEAVVANLSSSSSTSSNQQQLVKDNEEAKVVISLMYDVPYYCLCLTNIYLERGGFIGGRFSAHLCYPNMS